MKADLVAAMITCTYKQWVSCVGGWHISLQVSSGGLKVRNFPPPPPPPSVIKLPPKELNFLLHWCAINLVASLKAPME